MKTKPQSHVAYPDLLKLFFQEVGEMDAIPGRREYIPLTRRIERGRVLHNIASNKIGLQRLIMRINRQKREFIKACESLGIIVTDEDIVSMGEVEQFLDDYSIKVPPPLEKILTTTNDTMCWKMGWRLCYVLSLVDETARLNLDDLLGKDEARHLKSLDLIRSQYLQARLRLIEGTLRYTMRHASRYVDDSVTYMDLIQEGVIGMYSAVSRFEEFEGTHFQSYAATWVFQRISRYKADHSRLIRIPAHANDKLSKFQKLFDDDATTLSDDEILQHYQAQHPDPDKGYKEVTREVNQFLVANATHYPIDIPFRDKTTGRVVHFESQLVSPDDLETHVIDKITLENIHRVLPQVLNPRVCEIIMLRYGLWDGTEHTLEEIGQHFGITRERIRQLEAQALERLRKASHKFADGLSTFIPRTELALNATPLNRIVPHLPRKIRSTHDNPNTTYLQSLNEEHILKGKKRFLGGGRISSTTRKAYLLQVLQDAGIPLHSRTIHERSLAIMPPSLQCTYARTYSLLFYGQDFQKLGNGTFGIASWNAMPSETNSQTEYVLPYCPEPLRSARGGNAFLESVMVGRQHLGTHPYHAQEFYELMCEWAQQPASSSMRSQTMQGAFAAWYAVGLIGFVDFKHQSNPKLQLTLPTNLKLSQVRETCLNHLIQRIQKMPDLLAVMTKLGQPTLTDLQTVLFGDLHLGHDIPLRLELLESLEAIQPNGKTWMITSLGEKILGENYPDTLPDLSAIMENYIEANEVEAESDDLDWEELDDF